MKVYDGDIVINSNAGVTLLSIIAEATIVTSIDEGLVDEKEINIFPNPAKDEFTIDLSIFNSLPVDISILDGTGTEVYSVKSLKLVAAYS